jgi:hypothetical protein
MNAQAVAVERRYGRPIMSSLHALFGLGGLVGAGPAGIALVLAIDPLATVATIGHLGFLAGPPLIGVAAELTSLPIALGIVSTFCGSITLCSGGVEQGRPASPDAGSGRNR